MAGHSTISWVALMSPIHQSKWRPCVELMASNRGTRFRWAAVIESCYFATIEFVFFLSIVQLLLAVYSCIDIHIV